MDRSERIKSGIPGFDELIDGGIPRGFNVLITGSPGTGKTLFGLRYAYYGAKNRENAIYVTLNEEPAELRNQAGEFGWDIADQEAERNFAFLTPPVNWLKINLLGLIEQKAEEIKAKRIVFDDLSVFSLNADQFAVPLPSETVLDEILKRAEAKPRKPVHEAIENAKNIGGTLFYRGNSIERLTFLTLKGLSRLRTTNLVITSAGQNGEKLTSDGVSEYVADGLVQVKALTVGDKMERTLQVAKLRSTKINEGIYQLVFASSGLKIQI